MKFPPGQSRPFIAAESLGIREGPDPSAHPPATCGQLLILRLVACGLASGSGGYIAALSPRATLKGHGFHTGSYHGHRLRRRFNIAFTAHLLALVIGQRI